MRLQRLQHHRKHDNMFVQLGRKRQTVIVKIKRDMSGGLFVAQGGRLTLTVRNWVLEMRLLIKTAKGLVCPIFQQDMGTPQEHKTNCEQMWLSEVLFIENSHAHTHNHTHTPTHTHTPCYSKIRPVWTCQSPAEIEGEKSKKQRWLWRVNVGRFKGQIHLCSHILALHSRGYGAWLHTAASIMFMQALFHANPSWGNDAKTSPVSSDVLLKSRLVAGLYYKSNVWS